MFESLLIILPSRHNPGLATSFEILSAKGLLWRTPKLRPPSCLKILKEQDVRDFLSLIWLRLQLPGLWPLVKSNFNSCLGLLACWTDFILLICSDSKSKLLKAIFSASTKGTLYKNMTKNVHLGDKLQKNI